MSRRNDTRSGRPTRLDSKAPTTNPTWTILVNQDASALDNANTLTRSGAIAVAENHVVIDRTTPPQISPRTRHRAPSRTSAAVETLSIPSALQGEP